MAETALPEASTRPPRADARRNRARVLEAARTCFAESGLEAQVDEIARCAGVGVGTVYRHFPTKEALYEALASDHFLRLAATAREALGGADSWEAFSGFMRRAAELQASDRALAEVMRDAARGREDLHSAVAELVARAQAAGSLRLDVVPADVPMLMCGIGRATRSAGGPGMSWERYLAIVLDGLRVGGRSELPPPPEEGCA